MACVPLFNLFYPAARLLGASFPHMLILRRLRIYRSVRIIMEYRVTNALMDTLTFLPMEASDITDAGYLCIFQYQ